VLAVDVIGFPFIWLLMRGIPKVKIEKHSLSFAQWFGFLMMTEGLMIVGSLIGSPIHTVLTQPFNGETINKTTSMIQNSHILVSTLVAGIGAPVFEELIFRKAIIDRVGRYGELTAIVLSALTFGLFHMNLIQFFYAFGLGVLFAYLYLNTGRVRYTIMLHMIITFFGSVVSSAAFSGVSDDTWTKFDQFQHGTIGFSELSPFLPQLILPVLFVLLIIVLSITGIIVIITNCREIRLRPTPDEVPLKVAIPAAYLNVFFIIVAVICLGNMILTLFIS
jgi:membrane protease YdiL (CAAX protease family)